MRTVEYRRLEMFTRVTNFARDHARVFRNGSAAGRLLAQLDAHIKTLRTEVTFQLAGDRLVGGGVSERAFARAALRSQLEAIRKTARAVSNQRRDVSAKFARLRRATDRELVDVARSIAAEVAPNERALIEHHLPETFLADLDAAIARFAAAHVGRNAARTRRAELRVAVREALAGATDTVHAIDTVLRNAIGDDGGQMAAWTRLRRVQRTPGRRKQRKPRPRES